MYYNWNDVIGCNCYVIGVFWLDTLQDNLQFSRSAYFAARFTAEVTLLATYLLPQFAIIYWIIGFAPAVLPFILYLLITMLSAWNAQVTIKIPSAWNAHGNY